MSPDFEELVGRDVDPAERARLERVHDLLVAAGPPPDFAPEVVPVADVVELPSARRRRAGALIAIAAALAVALFAFGAAVVNGSTSTPDVVAMQGTAAAPNAAASIRVLDIDKAGNWPMRFTVSGLAPARSGRPFELWLTRDGEPAALCGSFATDETGAADVPMNAPYRFSEYDGWRVVEEGSQTPLLTT
jgi:hypothetical protein